MSNYIFYKNSSLERPRWISQQQYNSDPYGTEYSYQFNDSRFNIFYFTGSTDYKKIQSLKNTINYYSGFDDSFNFDNFYNKPTCLITLNSYYLGSGIEKGTVTLNINISGTVLASATDRYENGVLYDTASNKVGIVLYKEGIILLNNTASLTSSVIDFNGSNQTPKWVNFFASSSCPAISTDVFYSYVNNVETNIMFVTANKNELNHSNNATYIQSGSYNLVTGSNQFAENNKIEIKNVVKSPFVSGSAQFEKETYITRIGLYDKDKKLIGIATLANPVRKTENREYIFKLKLDI